jgi:CRP-like cAMP-binding protein
MALIVGEPRSVSAKVIEDSDLIQLDSKTFDEEIEGVPPWFMNYHQDDNPEDIPGKKPASEYKQ